MLRASGGASVLFFANDAASTVASADRPRS